MASSTVRHRVRDGALIAAVGLLAAMLIFAASAWRDRTSGDRFDLLRWERLTLPGTVVSKAGALFRQDPAPDDALARYFAGESGGAERRGLENAVEVAIAGRLDAVLRAEGVRGAVPVPGSVFPPIAFELAASPRVLVQSPREVIQRRSTDLLRPDISVDEAIEIEQTVEGRDATASALVVASGGVAAYPAIVAEDSTYAGTLAAVAHEWVHHYLAFYPLGIHYFDNRGTTALNETVADLVGDEVARLALDRFSDPTQSRDAASSRAPRTARSAGADDVNAVLRDLRREVDGLLAQGRIADAETRMEMVRQQLVSDGFRIRRINQAYFAWYGAYTARPDSIDPLGGQVREIRRRTGSLAAFLEVVRGFTARADVERWLAGTPSGGG